MAWGEQGNKITWTPNIVPDSQKLEGGWYDNPATGYNQRWTSGTGSNSTLSGFIVPEPDFEAIKREFAPIYENYDRDEQMAKNMQADEQKMLDESFVVANQKLAKNKIEREEFNREQENSLNRQYASAYEQAVNDYKALAQQGRVRFGGASSAGRAIGEIAQREYFKQSGQVQQTHADNLSKIQKDFRSYLSWSAEEEQRLVREQRNETTKLQNQFKQIILGIANNRNITKSEEQRQIRGAQELYRSRIADIQNQLRAEQMAMDQYREKLKLELDSQIELATKTNYQVAPNVFANDVKAPAQIVEQKTPISTNYQNYMARARYVDDEFDQNPYFIS